MDNCAVLIVSWDTYWPCNEPMYKMMHYFWKECDYPFYLCTKSACTEEKLYDRCIYAKREKGNWTGFLADYLSQIDEDYVFFLLVDHWPTAKIDDNAVRDAFNLLAQDNSIGVIYFRDSRGDFRKLSEYSNNNNYYEVPFGQAYRLCATPAVWRKSDLLKICEKDVSAWSFERELSYSESTKAFKVLVDKRSNAYLYMPAGAILKAKWVREAVKYSEKYNLNVDFSTLPILSRFETFMNAIKCKIFDINPGIIVWIQNNVFKGDGK